MKSKTIASCFVLAGAAALCVCVILFYPPLAVRYGTPAIRFVELSRWNNQQTKLSTLQRRVLFRLLYKDVGDPDAAGEALAILNAHMREDEDEIVRHLIYAAFTTKNPSDRHVALTGLLLVSPKHDKMAAAAFLYFLDHSDDSKLSDALSISTCINGMVKYSYVESQPAIRRLTNNPSKYLAATAQQGVVRLEALKRPDTR